MVTSMNYDENIILIEPSEIINVVRRSLSKIDRRLVDHGERVTYIARKIYDELPNNSDIDPSKLFVLTLFHDIGAYKAEEVDNMLQFETDMSFDHSLYGYLFLKNTAVLSEYAEAVLYHHTNSCELRTLNCPVSRYAEIIHLADRADILLECGSTDFSVFQEKSGSQFSHEDVTALLEAEKKYNITDELLSRRYNAEIESGLHLLELNNKDVVEYLTLLVYAIDFRSPYTVTHTADTTMISLELGNLMGLSPREIKVLYSGAFLHDIGKIAIPHEILEKPGKLTGEEFDIIKNHITEGEAILRGVVSDEICDIALRHHEKLDGSGYSKGLPGEALTLPQRIVAVADIFGALTQRRSYKEPFSKETVLAILKDMKAAGKICPKVTDTVCKNYDSIMTSIEESHDPVKSMYDSLIDEYDRLQTMR